MADPSSYRPAPGAVPTSPGVYKFRDADRKVIYVGKAINLRARLANYFQDLTNLHPRTRQMVLTAASVEWTVVGTEVEALQLEYTWIKRYDPRFNVKYRDDKTYPMLAISLGEMFPRAFFYRGPRRKGVRYFGPFSHAWVVRETLELLTRIFPMRTCAKGVFNRHRQLGRPCLLGYIDKCAAPCIGRVSAAEHRDIAESFSAFMAGHTGGVRRRLEQDMRAAAEALDFERAARLRDDIAAIDKITEQQTVVLSDGTDADFISCQADDLEAAVQVFQVRQGRVRSQRGWVVETPGENDAELMQGFLMQFYGTAVEEAYEIPRTILVDALPADTENIQAALESFRGGPVDIRVPQRGDKRTLLDTVGRNAQEALRQHKLKRIGDLTTRSAALQDVQDALELEEAPLRIECIDISHLQGTDIVASLVVFEDGLPKKSDYRRYRIKEAAGEGHSDDVASIAEVTRRRFRRHNYDKRVVSEESAFPDEETTNVRRFAYPPQLFLVDGGASQVAAAQQVLDELGIVDVALAGLAKRLEELWLPGEDEPVILPRNSQGLYLLQHIRDEAHRFAITYHRQQRSKRMRHSALDDIKGLGQTRRTELVKYFGSLKKLREASPGEIAEVPGFGPKLAQLVYDGLHR